jgi:retinol dehydrogenase-12
MERVRALHTSLEIASHYGSLAGRCYLITGASNGLGLETAKALAAASATVVLACRGGTKAASALEAVRASSPAGEGRVELLELDLGSLGSVRACAASFVALKLPLHALICNAGINGVQRWGQFSPGIESTFAVNFLGHFLLHQCLHASLAATPASRLVILASESHRRITEDLPTLAPHLPPPEAGYDSLRAYAFSNLCRILWCRKVAREVPYPCVCLHPAVVAGTGMMQHMGILDSLRQVFLALWWEVRPSNPLQSWQKGSRLQTWVAVAPPEALTPLSGAYLSGNDCHVFGEALETSPQAASDGLADELVQWAREHTSV